MTDADAGMLNGAAAFTTNIRSWDILSVTSMQVTLASTR